MDLPVFFYIDPDFANDPALEYMDQMLLSYTFFESKPNLSLPSPFDPENRPVNRKLEEKLKTTGVRKMPKENEKSEKLGM